MGNRRIGRRRLRSIMQTNYSADDTWGLIRPPMVPGLERSKRVIALGEQHGFGFEDSEDLPADGTTTSTWVREDENSAAIALVGNDADFTDGCMSLTAGGSANDAVGFGAANGNLLSFTSGKQWWMETSIKLGDHDNCEFFFGVSEAAFGHATLFATVAAGVGADKTGFRKGTHNDDTLGLVSSKNASEVTADPSIEYDADNDVLTMGIHWNGVDAVDFYAANSATGTEAGAMTKVGSLSTYSDQSVGPHLQVTSTGGSMVTLVNYIRVCWEI